MNVQPNQRSLEGSQETVACPGHDICVSRQPIFDCQRQVFAYDLLFYPAAAAQAGRVQDFQATAQGLLQTFLEIGLEAVVGTQRAFLPLTRGFLLFGYASVFPADRVVLELSMGTPVDADLLEVLHALAAQGYTIALGDFTCHDSPPALVTLADIVKIDIQALDCSTVEKYVALLQPCEVTLLATKVATPEEFTYCKDLGFTYFQGPFCCQPDVVTGQRSPTNRLAILHLLGALQDPDVDFDTLETLISQDVSLSYKVLRLINSAFFGLKKNVTSIRQALLLLGLKFITTWTSLLVLSGLNDKPHELLTTALVRAKMCEGLAQAMGRDDTDSFFLVGLFSVLDALLDQPMPEVLQALPLAADPMQALLHGQGVLGSILRNVVAYEQGNWEEITWPDVDHRAVMDAYLVAIAWATDISNTLV